MDELKAQPTRRRIVEDIDRHPGSSGRDVQHRLGLGWGETAYHLERLVKAGAVRRERGGWRDYYYAPEFSWVDRKIIQALRSPTERSVLLHLAEHPDLTVAELRDRAELGKSTASFHLSRLSQAGLIQARYAAGQRRYSLTERERMIDILRSYHSSFRDELVDRFGEAFGGLFVEEAQESSSPPREVEPRPARGRMTP